MKSSADFFAEVEAWFTGDHISLLSFVVAALALLASVWTTLVSRKSVKVALRSAAAAEKQAEAANEQAEAANEQARQASMQLAAARKAAEVDALTATKARIDATVPSVAVIVSPMDNTPRLLPRDDPIPVPHPKVDGPDKRRLDRAEVRNDSVYFVHRGMLINDGENAVRIYASYARFYVGQHPTSGLDIPLPIWSAADHCHIIEGGHAVVFELRIAKRIDGFLEQSDKVDDEGNEIPFSRDQLMILPGNLDQPRLIINITTYADPFEYDYDADVHTPLVMRANGNLQIAIQREPTYPKSVEHLHAELLGDTDKLRALDLHDDLRRLSDRRKRSGSTP